MIRSYFLRMPDYALSLYTMPFPRFLNSLIFRPFGSARPVTFFPLFICRLFFPFFSDDRAISILDAFFLPFAGPPWWCFGMWPLDCGVRPYSALGTDLFPPAFSLVFSPLPVRRTNKQRRHHPFPDSAVPDVLSPPSQVWSGRFGPSSFYFRPFFFFLCPASHQHLVHFALILVTSICTSARNSRLMSTVNRDSPLFSPFHFSLSAGGVLTQNCLLTPCSDQVSRVSPLPFFSLKCFP